MGKRIWLMLVVLLTLCAPFVAAHATPYTYEPAAESILTTFPTEVKIYYSERVESSASSIEVFSPQGNLVSAPQGVADGRQFAVPMTADGAGTYRVEWHIVSADDGHFTKGSFTFSVEHESVRTLTTQIQIQHLTTIPETITIFVDMLGLALLIGLIVFVLCGFKQCNKVLKGLHLESYIKPLFTWGSGLVILGTASHLILKTTDLMQLRSTDFVETFFVFAKTASGSFTYYRLSLAILAFVFFWQYHQEIVQEKRSWHQYVTLTLILAMMATRVRISHAAASDILPFFSLSMTFVHFVAKNAWVGLLVVIVCALLPLFRSIKKESPAAICVSHLSMLITICFVVAGVSGAYVAWLHLKTFDYIQSSQWGGRFMILAAIGVWFFLVRLYNQLRIDNDLANHSESFLGAGMSYTLELLIGVSLLASTSILVLTTPPVLPNYSRFFGSFDMFILMSAVAVIIVGKLLYNFSTQVKSHIPIKDSELHTWGLSVVSWSVAAGLCFCMLISVAVFHENIVAGEFQHDCEDKGHFWLQSVPLENGVPQGINTVTGCTTNIGLYHFEKHEDFLEFLDEISFNVEMFADDAIQAGQETTLTFQLHDEDGNPLEGLTVEHDRLIHILIIDEELNTFSHLHPEEQGQTKQQIESGQFTLTHTFDRPSTYSVLIDMVVKSESFEKQWFVNVSGQNNNNEEFEAGSYRSTQHFEGYDVTLKGPKKVVAGKEMRFTYQIEKDGKDVDDLEPYLSAAMHIAIFKDDLSEPLHTHGELWLPGSGWFQRLAPTYVSFHSHFVPDEFGPRVSVPIAFPEEGRYVLFGELKHQGETITTKFFVDVEKPRETFWD